MQLYRKTLKPTWLLTGLYIFLFSFHSQAQKPESNRIQDLKTHGIEQFQNGHYELSSATLSKYLDSKILPTGNIPEKTINAEREEAGYYLHLSDIKRNETNAVIAAQSFINHDINPVFRQRLAFAIAQNYFQKNELKSAIEYYEIAGIENLSNEEIADAKFELAYCYFNEQRFDQALPLFAAIKELPDNKYYLAGNYYYGLLAYNNKDYKNALRSFDRIKQQDAYKDIVPYYQAEINYFLGEPDKVLSISNSYLRKKGDLFYRKEMQLLTAQTLFEQKKYKEALPYFEYYYDNSDKIRKEELYELAYSYYRLEKWNEAIEKFKPLSNAKDSLGQTSMYLLGDCYLKINDKKGARNAFGICADMNYNTSQKEAASFLNAKLSYELGDEGFASKKLYSFLKEYPESSFSNEAKTLLTGLLAKNSNYGEAFAILSDMADKDNQTWTIYQQVAVGKAMQLMQNNEIKAADSILSLSLQQPINPDYEAIAYFWKGDIAYLEKRYPQAIQYSRSFIEKAKNRESSIRTISANATVQNANLNIGYAQLESEDFNAAQSSFETAQKTKTNGYSDILAADATLRQADALFMQKNYSAAATAYDEAINSGISNPDYAKYQKSLIFGLQGKFNEKKSLLNSIVQKWPVSNYKNDAQYELAITNIETGQFGDAIPLLKSLSGNSAISDNIRAKSSLSLAYAYAQDNQQENAIDQYKKYIFDYPSSSERADALDALRNLYISEGAPEKYAAFLKDKSIPEATEESIENTYYDAATQEYGVGNWAKSAEGFRKYLDRFPNGKYAAKARFYRAESNYQLKDYTQALADYEAVQNEGWSEYAEEASLKAAEITFENKDYAKAQQNFLNLRNTAMDESNLQTAYIGLMKSGYNLTDYKAAETYADTLLTISGISNKTIAEALLYKAKAQQMQLKYDAAILSYQEVAKKNVGAFSAEARYRVAEILLIQKKLKDAETQAVFSAQNSGGQEYWVINSYILLADIMTEQKDYFNAKATLQSVIKNAGDADLKSKATQKLERVKNLEKAGSKLSE